MKNIKEILIEKLILNKNSKKNYNVDELNNDNIILYDSSSEEDEDTLDWEDTQNQLKDIDDNYDGFVLCRFNSLSKSKNLEKDVIDYGEDLQEISEKILNGKDLGYEIKLVKGHLEFHCINSGSRAIYYIYALSEEGYQKIETYFDEPESLDGDDSDKLLFLLEEGNILPIEI